MLQPGDLLPRLRELSRKQAISPRRVDAVLRLLADEGVLLPHLVGGHHDYKIAPAAPERARALLLAHVREDLSKLFQELHHAGISASAIEQTLRAAMQSASDAS